MSDDRGNPPNKIRAHRRQRGPGTFARPKGQATGIRLYWADCAKGMSIIGVCYMHVITGVPGGQDGAWKWFNEFLDPIRMPMFFLISGLFAHRVIERTIGDLWYRRLWFLLVPYLVFTPFVAASRLYIDGKLFIDGNVSAANLVRSIVVGDPGVWFLYALMVFNIVACLTRKLPPLVAVCFSVLPAVAVALAGLSSYNEITHLTGYLPAFFLGLHFRQVFIRLAGLAADVRVIAACAAVFVWWEWIVDLAAEFVAPDGWSTTEQSVMSLLGMVRILTAVPLGILLAVWISRIPLVSSIFAAIGRNTLPIYVSHQLMLFLVYDRLLPWLVGLDESTWGFVMQTDPRIVIGLVTCVLSGLLFYGIGRVPGLRWILYPPPLPRRQPD
ncbi:MAG: acyltransferase family protein [Mycobacteriaceae bacterium]|uniref:acyltransferase family protein n=1 Tax=Corynebacterium sp. TaxID=1720 RepID=UPI003F9B3E85